MAWVGIAVFTLLYAMPFDPDQGASLKKAKRFMRALNTFLKAYDVPSIEQLPQDDEGLRAFVESRLLQQAGHKLAADLMVSSATVERFWTGVEREGEKLKHMYESAEPFDLVAEQPLTAYEEHALNLLADKQSLRTGLVRSARASGNRESAP